MKNKNPLTYKETGVDITRGDKFAERTLSLMRGTFSPRVIRDDLGYAGLFSLDYPSRLFARNFRQPVLVSSTDGVGTKLKLAFEARSFRSVGIDLVAMSVNDVVVQGAEPLFFLDYIATSLIEEEALAEFVEGIAEGCHEANSALIGGETAEMPGFYAEGEFDAAGFSVGVVEKKRMILGKEVEPQDVVIGLGSSGVHSNGFTLVRKILDEAKLTIDSPIPGLGKTVREEFLIPTRIYVKSILAVLANYRVKKVVKGLAHVTGGGLVENVPRVLPEGCRADIEKGSWPVLPVFQFLQKEGALEEEEMFRVFNMGIGMVMIVSQYFADSIMGQLKKLGEKAYVIGEIRKGERGVRIA